MEDKKQPIIVKKIKKGGHGHHGGAWKVAFADFAVAMMAFFMVMWLLGAATKVQLAGISQYFDSVTLVEGTSPVASQGMAGPGGASTSMIDMGGQMNLEKGDGDKPNEQFKADSDQSKIDQQVEVEKERRQLMDLMKDIKQSIDDSEALAAYKNQLKIDITPEGLRIQILDEENRPMFNSGQASLRKHMIDILSELAIFINSVPNKISISGHTDAIPYVGRKNYSNWELSADRANTARRTLVDGGLDEDRLGRVVGLGSSILFDPRAPEAPINRRISIIVMNKATEQAMLLGEGGEMLSNLDDLPIGSDDVIETPAQDINTKPQLAPIGDDSAGVLGQGNINPINSILRDLQDLNPDAKPIPAKKKPVEEAEPKADDKKAKPPGLKLPPIIDPALLPKNP